MRLSLFAVGAAVVVMTSVSSQAFAGYPAELTSQFVSWCSTSQNQPQTVCSCAVNQASIQIPAAGMASFLSAAEGNGMAATSQGVGATALQIVTSCAVTSGGSTGAAAGGLMNSVGGMFGN